ncbi:secreted protein, partial [Rhodopirellula sallentina SM41]
MNNMSIYALLMGIFTVGNLTVAHASDDYRKWKSTDGRVSQELAKFVEVRGDRALF